jgi:hypothetical protein
MSPRLGQQGSELAVRQDACATLGVKWRDTRAAKTEGRRKWRRVGEKQLKHGEVCVDGRATNTPIT